MRERRPPQALRQSRVPGHVRLERAAPLSNQMEADVRGARARPLSLGRQARALNGAQRGADLGLRGTGLGELLDRLSVAVAAQEVHARVDAGRIAPQDALNEAHGLDVFAPVEAGDKAQTGDDVGRGDLGNGLALMLAADRVLGGHARERQMCVEAATDGLEAGTVFTHAVKQLDDLC